MSTIWLEIVTPERKVYSAEVDMVIVRGELGEVGILPKHSPFVTPLVISAIRIKKDGNEQLIAISGGFIEVNSEKVVILAEAAELPEDIDVDRAMAAKERAERLIEKKQTDALDFKRAHLAIQRAVNRIQVAQKK